MAGLVAPLSQELLHCLLRSVEGGMVVHLAVLVAVLAGEQADLLNMLNDFTQ